MEWSTINYAASQVDPPLALSKVCSLCIWPIFLSSITSSQIDSSKFTRFSSFSMFVIRGDKIQKTKLWKMVLYYIHIPLIHHHKFSNWHFQIYDINQFQWCRYQSVSMMFVMKGIKWVTKFKDQFMENGIIFYPYSSHPS